MKIIIVGYGRVGTQLVRLLAHKNHSIVVIDKGRDALEKAPEEAGVRVLIGDAVDPDMLRLAGADKADVLLALTREENTNLMVAQMARIAFQVPKVVAMVYDPQREISFHAAGVDTLQITVTGAQLLAAQIEGGGAASLQELFSAVSGESSKTKEAPFPVPLRTVSSTGPHYVIIMGGGKVGYYLGRTLLEEGHEITIVEADPDIHALVTRQLDCP